MLGSSFTDATIYDVRRFALVIVMAYLALRALPVILATDRVPAGRLFYAGLSLIPYTAVSISGLFASSPLFAWTDVLQYAFWHLSILVVARLALTPEESRLEWITSVVATVAAAAMIVYSLMSLMGYFLFYLAGDFPTLTGILPYGFANLRFFSHMGTWLLPLMPLAALRGPFAGRRSWRYALLASTGLWYWLLWASMSRGSMIALALAAAFVLLLFRARAREWLQWQLKAVLLGAGFTLVLSSLLPWLVLDQAYGARDIKTGDSRRLAMWAEAFRMSLERFPLGQGPIAYVAEQCRLRGHPHNMYLMIAAEWGWLAVAGFGAVVAPWVRGIVSVWRTGTIPLSRSDAFIGLTAATAAGFLHAGLSGVFMAPASMLAAVLVLGLFTAHTIGINGASRTTSDPKHPQTPIPALARWGISGVVIVMLGVFVAMNIEFHRQTEAQRERLYSDPVYPRDVSPRYWQDGHFVGQPLEEVAACRDIRFADRIKGPAETRTDAGSGRDRQSDSN